MRAALAVLSVLFLAQVANAGVAEALAAVRRDDFQTAIAEFSALARNGDADAMITLGLYYQQGRGVPQDYAKAMDWYLQAFSLFNGDAYNNIGVMYRDGEGVKANRKIAHDLFLMTHMRGLGTEATQYRAGRNLDRERAEQTPAELREALCYTEEFVKAYVLSRGKASPRDLDLMATLARPAIKDNDWWLPSEREGLKFDCPK